MSNTLPITIIIGTSINDREATDKKIEAGHYTRAVVEYNTEEPETVCSFVKKYLISREPAWLYHIFQHEKSENSTASAYDNAVVAFGGGEAVGIKVRQSGKDAANTSTTSQGFGFVMNLYQIERDNGNKPIMLHPKGK